MLKCSDHLAGSQLLHFAQLPWWLLLLLLLLRWRILPGTTSLLEIPHALLSPGEPALETKHLPLH